MSKPLRATLVVTCLAVLVIIPLTVGHFARSRDALAKYKADLRAKGEKLTFQELVGSIATNNFGSDAALTNAVAKIRTQPGAFDPSRLEPRKLQSPGRARVIWMAGNPAGLGLRGKSPGEGWANFDGQMEQNQAVTAELREFFKLPPASFGLRTNFLG